MRFFAEIRKGSFLDRSWRRQRKQVVGYKGLRFSLVGGAYTSDNITDKELMPGLERDDCIILHFISNPSPVVEMVVGQDYEQPSSLQPIVDKVFNDLMARDPFELKNEIYNFQENGVGDLLIQADALPPIEIKEDEAVSEFQPDIITDEDLERELNAELDAELDAVPVPTASQEEPTASAEPVLPAVSVIVADDIPDPELEFKPEPPPAKEKSAKKSLPKSVMITDEEREKIRKKYAKKGKKK